MMLLQLLTCAILASSLFAAKLPSGFTKCNRKDSDCLTKAVETALQQLSKPIKEVGLVSFAPLEVPELHIGAGSGAAAFDQKFKDLKVSGFQNLKCDKVEFDSSKNTLSVDCTFPKIRMDFNYEVNGQILVLPITGNGVGLIVLDDVHMPITFDLEEYDKNGHNHFKIKDHKVKIDPKLIHFRLDNLFNGDKVLGDNINQVMNDNWKEVFSDVQPSYEDAFGKIFSSAFDRLLSKVPISDLFNDDA